MTVPSFLLHRVILRELAQTFLICAGALLTIILIGKGIQARDLFLGLDLSATDTLLLFLFLVPTFLTLILPISCMISVFLTFLRMSSDRELTALRAGGVSAYQLLSAPAMFSLLCMGLAFLVSMHGIAWGMGKFRSTVMDIAHTRAKVSLQPGVFNQNLLGLTLFARRVDPDSGRLFGVLFEDKTQPEHSSTTILAPTGEIVTDAERGEIIFNLENGRLYRVEQDEVSIILFENYSIRLHLNKLFEGMDMGDIRPKEMSLADLRRFAKVEDGGSARFLRKVQVEIQKRWALPVACLTLGLFAFPLACSFEGARRQTGVVLSLFFFLLYYSIFSLGLTMGESGALSPLIGLWAGNILFALAAAGGVVLVARERLPAFFPLSRIFQGNRL
ncbi:MAG: LPS export ABC transporter permease LptF [Desulfovibrio sp.]|nr:LPS export ABC transporter permease LptF [Desulfovibrio sp.]